MMAAVTAALTTLISWVGTVVEALMTGGTLEALLPLFAIGIAVSAFRMAMGSIRRVTWGA